MLENGQADFSVMVMMSSVVATISESTIGIEDIKLESKREWGEEKHDNVIYNVMLKRVRKTPSPSHTSADGLQWETQKVRSIKGATIGYLVSQLCQSFMEDWGEKNFLTVFLATYRSFAKPVEVMDKIVKECNKLSEESLDHRRQFLMSTVKVLRTWLERYFDEDFYDPPRFPLLHMLITLAHSVRDDINNVERDFIDYVESKLKAAEVKNLQEAAIENLNSPSRFSDIHVETEDISVECETGKNYDAAKTLLNVFSALHVAEQITVKDANLFLRVVPHHCLNAVRSSKYKPACVRATIDQFNRVVYCVLGTCLCPSLKASQRVKIFCKWIEIAQQCRELKNFSSLRAIVSTLQTHVIHRLKKTWQQVPHGHTNLLQEMAQINIKDMIRKVGTAKVNTETSSISKVKKDATFRRQRNIHSGIVHGTVPYLGSFLTDLTYLHTARADYIEEGVINFEKCRKEFEQLAQLQLWQASCKGYQHLDPDHKFNEWFNSIHLPTDEQAQKLSEQIESVAVVPISPGLVSTPAKRTLSEMFSNHISLVDGSTSSHVASNHVRSASDDTTDSSSRLTNQDGKANGHVTKIDLQSDEERNIQVIIIRKSVTNEDLSDPVEWKEMKLSSNYRTAAVIRMAFTIFEAEEKTSGFNLVQLLPENKDLHIPDSSNVFYAMNSSLKEFYFALLEQGADIPSSIRPQSLQSTPSKLETQQPKSKKQHRKTLSTSAVNQSGSSPMRNLYRHLAMGGMSLVSSGSYSPARELQRNEIEAPEHLACDSSTVESAGPSPHLHERRSALTALDDSVIMFSARPSNNSDEDNDDGWRHKVWKKMHKGHKRNPSDTVTVDREYFEETRRESSEMRPRAVLVQERPVRPVVLPVQVEQSMIARSESVSTYSPESATPEIGSTHDPNYDDHYKARHSGTMLRERVLSSSPTWSRRHAVRKHHSDHRPAPGTYRQLSEAELSLPASLNMSQLTKAKPIAPKRSDSRSKFYISAEEGMLDSRKSSSSSIEPIRENTISANFRKYPAYARSCSDPCILDRASPVDDVFGYPGSPRHDNPKPLIVIECPSPKKSPYKTKFEQSLSYDDNANNDLEVGVETTLEIPVENRSRSSTVGSENTYL